MQERMQVAIGGPQGHTALARNLFEGHFTIVFQQLADQIQALFLLHGFPPHLCQKIGPPLTANNHWLDIYCLSIISSFIPAPVKKIINCHAEKRGFQKKINLLLVKNLYGGNISKTSLHFNSMPKF
jgi:hypothetical protein